MNSTIPGHNLPNDIIFLIFSKSTVKSLLRLITVSKSVNALIRSSTFVAAHHHNQIHNNNSNTIDTHVVYMPNGDCEPERREIYMRSRYKYDKNCNLPWPFHLAGACEGLMCLVKDSDVYILNPCVGSVKTVPPCGSIDCDGVYRFYFDERSCDYKILKQIYNEDASLINLEIYSLATDSWKIIEYKSSGCHFDIRMLILLKRFAYWKGVSRLSQESKTVFLKFDLDEEIFVETTKSYPCTELTCLSVRKSKENEHIHMFAFYHEPTWIYVSSPSEYYFVQVRETLMLFDKKDKSGLWIWRHIPTN